MNKQADSHHNQQQKNVFYFYQSSDGQAIFLHPINVQMLVRCYGALEMCPETIEGRIVEVETLSMTEELRNRLRYLGHIPVSKQFQITEIALTEPVMDPMILEEFGGTICAIQLKWDVNVLYKVHFLQNESMKELVDDVAKTVKNVAETWKFSELKMPSGVVLRASPSSDSIRKFIFQDSAPDQLKMRCPGCLKMFRKKYRPPASSIVGSKAVVHLLRRLILRNHLHLKVLLTNIYDLM